ncbi:MAG: hypothetical protein ABW221_06180 [Vicinamibacteria bacterium]
MRLPLALTAVLFLAAPLHADVWDQDTSDRDDGPGTFNELLHGSVQLHDLATEAGVADQDWYRIAAQPYASYEVVVEGITGDVSNLRLELLAADGVTVLASGFAREPGGLTAKAVRQSNQTTTPVTWFVRVDGAPACGVACTTADQYTVRLYNTTGSFARFDNTGTVRTTVYLQNTSGVFGSSALLTYWDANGARITSCVFDLRAKASVVLDTSGCGGAARAGSMSVDVRLPFGAIAGKAVEVDSANGRVRETALALAPR